MKTVPYEVVRVFTNKGKNGNGLAVFLKGHGLKKKTMQAIAKKLGFSETAFVFEPTDKSADYRVRFFTPEVELPFAGHPSLGTLFVLRSLRQLGKKKEYIQQSGKRLLKMSALSDGRIRMDQGKPIFGKKLPQKICASLLRISDEKLAGQPMVVSTGNPHIIIPLRDRRSLEKAAIDMRVYKKVTGAAGALCVMPFTVNRGAVTCRMFAPGLGVPEDPATGSGCGPLAAYLARENLLPGSENKKRFVIKIKQGMRKGGSLLYAWVEKDGAQIKRVAVGGSAVPTDNYAKREITFIGS